MQIECALKYEAIYDCYTQKEEANLREKFLLDQMEQAVNTTELGMVFKFSKVSIKYQGLKDVAPFHLLLIFENPNGSEM